MVTAGVRVGLPAAMLGGRALSSQLFGLSPADRTTVGTAVVILLGVAALAGYLPARAASRVDPLVALRRE